MICKKKKESFVDILERLRCDKCGTSAAEYLRWVCCRPRNRALDRKIYECKSCCLLIYANMLNMSYRDFGKKAEEVRGDL